MKQASIKKQLLHSFFIMAILWANCLFIQAVQPFAPLFIPKKQEVRAVWLTTIKGLDWPTTRATSEENIVKQKKELTDILDKLQEARINTVILQTRVRGNLIYPSRIETWCESFSGEAGCSPGYDPLAFAIEECHKRGMEIHAWMVTIPLGSVEVHKDMGAQSITKRNPKICTRFRNNWYLNPGHPETKNYLKEIVKELVTNYDIDGIHLDYIRYPDRPIRFPDASDYRKYGRGFDNLAQWRRNNITEIVRTIHAEVKKLKPWVKVSSAPLGKYRDTQRYPSRGWNAYHAVHQEAQLWMHEGIHDMIFPMLYYRNNDFYPFVLDWKEQSNGRIVVPGLGIYFLHPSEGDWTLDEVERQLNFIRWSNCNGEAYFRSRFLTENTRGLYNCVQERYYRTLATIPPMPWIDNVPPSKPTAVTLSRKGSASHLHWQPSTDNTDGGVHYNVYASTTYPVDTENPENLVAIRLKDCSYLHHHFIARGKAIHYAVTATDRCGNESDAVQLSYPDKPVNTTPTPVHQYSPQRLTIEEDIVCLPQHITGEERVIVTNIAGRPIADLPFNRKLNIKALPAGIYIVNTTTNGGEIRKVGFFTKK